MTRSQANDTSILHALSVSVYVFSLLSLTVRYDYRIRQIDRFAADATGLKYRDIDDSNGCNMRDRNCTAVIVAMKI